MPQADRGALLPPFVIIKNPLRRWARLYHRHKLTTKNYSFVPREVMAAFAAPIMAGATEIITMPRTISSKCS